MATRGRGDILDKLRRPRVAMSVFHVLHRHPKSASGPLLSWTWIISTYLDIFIHLSPHTAKQ